MGLLFILGYAALPVLYRAFGLERSVGGYTSGPSVAFLETLRNDYVILAVVLALLLGAACLRNMAAALACFVAGVALHAVLILDVLIYDQFYQRLNFADTMKYGSYALAYFLDMKTKFLVVVGGAAVLFALASHVLWRLVRGTAVGGRAAAIGVFALGASSLAAWQTRDTGYVHYRFFQNVVSYNKTISSEFTDYSPDFAASLVNPFERTCAAGPGLSGPVVFFMVESLSSYQSAFFSGLNDWTPELDRIAAENLALRNMHANGFTTEDGELSLLTGEWPIYPPNSFTTSGSTMFSGYWAPEQSLVSSFQDAGYETRFLTTSDLGFASTGDWMNAIGFDHVEGSEAPFYEGQPRFAFDAASDAVLVERVLDVLQGADARRFLFVKTVSSHHPYIHPDTGARSEEQIIRYVDQQIAALHAALTAQGFFETGHLVIVGDHRALLPLDPSEVAHFGLEKALTQIPAVVIGNQLAPVPRAEDAPFSQVDLARGFMDRLRGQVCSSPVQGSIWGPGAVAPDYIIHRFGHQRNQIGIFAKERLGAVTLDGDATAFSGAGFTDKEQTQLTQFINYMRVRAARANARAGPATGN